jgi:2-dehydropantoate 2-reductase
MKVCIFGAGAVGGLIGARLAHAGVEVSAVARSATAAALREHGWRLQIGGQTIAAPVRAVHDASELAPQDYVVIAVKAPAMVSVAPVLRELSHPQTTFISAMNGVPWWFFHGLAGAFEGLPLATIDPDGVIDAAIPIERVMGAVVHLTCSTPEPGVVRHGVGNRLIVGEPKGGSSARLLAFAELLREAAFEVEVSPRIQQDIWYKLWGNMTMNPISAFTGATADRILDDPLVNQFCLDVMAEAAAIGAAIGCPIAQSGADRMTVTRKLGAFKTSMLQDVEAGKLVEIDALLSAPREIGARASVATPHLDTLLGFARLHARVHRLYPESATR